MTVDSAPIANASSNDESSTRSRPGRADVRTPPIAGSLQRGGVVVSGADATRKGSM